MNLRSLVQLDRRRDRDDRSAPDDDIFILNLARQEPTTFFTVAFVCTSSTFPSTFTPASSNDAGLPVESIFCCKVFEIGPAAAFQKF